MAFHRLHCTPFLVELLHAVLLNYCTPLSYWLKDQSSNSLLLADYYQNDMEVSNLFWLYAGTKVVTRMAVDGGVASGGEGENSIINGVVGRARARNTVTTFVPGFWSSGCR